MPSWEVWLSDPYGTRLALLDQFTSGTAAKIANSPGAFSLTMPADYDDLLRLDGIVEVWRKPDGGALRLFDAYLIRQMEYADDGGREITVIGGPDGVDLLRRRIVAYASGTTEAAGDTEAADDLMKRVVRLNLTTDCADTDRDWSGQGFTVAADATAAPNITLGFSRRNLLELFRDVAEDSRAAGTNLYYDVVPVPTSGGTVGWEFRTYTNQPGQDRTGADQVIFGRDWGNLEGASIAFDYSEESTVMYAGGRGTDTDRSVEEVEDTSRSGASPWNRCEAFINASGLHSTSDEYVDAGYAALSEKRPRLKVTGEIIDTPQARFGVDWNWGDRVVIAYRGRQYDAVITAVTLTMQGGRESIKAVFEVQL